MDLTAQDIIKHFYVEDEGNLTITFKNEAEDTTFGTIKIEAVRARAFLDSLSTLTKELYGDLTPGLEKARTNFDEQTLEAITEF